MSKICNHCRQPFEILPEDIALLERLAPKIAGQIYSLPEPTLCPGCRLQRRLAFRNERTLYHRKCDLSGRSMISMHPADSPFPVYHITEWLSDKWDPKDYGQDFDFARPFFEQFFEFCQKIPHFNAFVDPHLDINSEYTNCSSEAKNCYMITQAEKNEDCYYSRGINSCRNCCDCLRVHACELCYECIDCNTCYHTLYSQDCDNCSDCFFSSDLRGCKYCFGCHGLVQKQYYIFNKPVDQKQWAEKVTKLILTHEIVAAMQQKSAAARLKVPQRAVRQIQCENVIGDHVNRSRESHYVFDSNDLEHCRYCNEIANGAKDCMDYAMWGIHTERLYECIGCGYNVYNCLFCCHCWQNVSDLLYCESCFPAVKNCFGCFGLRQSQYCILNKQYSKQEYENLVPKIIAHMKTTSSTSSGQAVEWGEFFPIEYSAYAYNETLAQLFFPLTQQQAALAGYRWQQEKEEDRYLGPPVSIPATITEVPDDICQQVLRCEVTKKPYRITQQELEFYRKLGIPIPKKAPLQRHMERQQKRRPRQLFERTCHKCNTAILSIYPTDAAEMVYCEECYLQAIY